MPTLCKHCGDEAEDLVCRRCNTNVRSLAQCRECHRELVHDLIGPVAVDVRDPKTSWVDNGPFLVRPTKGFDEPTAVHEGKAGQSLADGWAMLNGYEDADDQYRSNQKPKKARPGRWRRRASEL